jgi:hypothetical protein
VKRQDLGGGLEAAFNGEVIEIYADTTKSSLVNGIALDPNQMGELLLFILDRVSPGSMRFYHDLLGQELERRNAGV